jgi:hypothetical protein
MMAKYMLRGGALLTAIAITSPAWAGWEDISAWLPKATPQPGGIGVLLLAVLGVLVGRFASRKRRDP